MKNDISIHSIDAPLTVRVTVARRFLWRLQLGLWIIKLGAWITPLKVSVETDDDRQ